MPEQEQRQTTTTTTSTATSTSSGGGDTAQELVGNAGIVDLIKALNHPTGPREFNPNKTAIVHVGLNKYAHDEAAHLNRLNRDGGGALSARQRGEEQDVVHRGGTKYDLTTEEGAARYVATLGLPDQMAVDAAEFLVNGPGEARDELAQLVRIYSEAEMGERRIDRMVLSGHSVGSQIWGDDNGNISFDTFTELSKIFPNAAKQVQHLMLSACYSGGEAKMSQYFEMYPELQSIMAYHGSSPGTWSGAMDHMTGWENATEPGKDAAGIDPELARGHRKAENVSTWNTTDGYQGDKPMSIWELERELNSQDSVYQDHLSGRAEVSDPQSGPLRDYYALVQRTLSHADASSGLLDRMAVRRDVTIRLLYFELVSTKFRAHYGDTLAAGYEEAGLEMPDFGNMSRAETLRAIEELEAAGGGSESAQALDLLQRGLRDMDSEVIPTNWV
jgi:hypothetical protein